MKTKLCLALSLILCLFVTACTSGELNTLAAIVSAAELFLPAIPGIPAADIPAVTAYTNAALQISEDLLNNASAPQLSKAIGDFNALALPQITSTTDPKTAALLNGLGKAIQNFVATYKGASVSALPTGVHAFAEPAKTKTFHLSDKQKKDIEKLKARIKAAKAKLKK